jgi:5'-nucleotidase
MITRRKFLKIAGGAGLAAGLTGLPLGLLAGGKEDFVTISILSTNDMHSRIEPFPANDRRFAGMGGMARRAAMIKQIRAEGNEVLLLDAGDIFQGTPYYNVYHGELELKLMTEMGYDAATIGNHEFDNGLENLLEQIPKAGFPFICSNYDFSDTILAGKTIDHKVFDKNGIKIGVYGLGVELNGLVSPDNYGKAKYLDPVETALHYEKMLKDKGCNLIIALSHLGFEYNHDKISDLKLAALTNYTDMIVGGHTHTFLDDARIVKNQQNKDVVISQAGWGGINLGKTDFVFSKKFMQTVSISNTTKFFKSQV